MDEVSVTRPSTARAIVADEAFCAQAAAVLMCDQEPVRKAFIGEPAGGPGDGPLGPLP